MSALGCGPCGSANGVSIPAEARNTRAATSRETLDADPPNIDEEEFTRLMAWYTSASSLYNQARLTVEMLEDQRADGADVECVQLRKGEQWLVHAACGPLSRQRGLTSTKMVDDIITAAMAAADDPPK